MMVALISNGPSEKRILEMAKKLEDSGVSHRLLGGVTKEGLEGVDMAIVVGGDGDVLRAFQRMGDSVVPVLGMSESDEAGFLTERGISDFPKVLERLINSDFQVEEASRISVTVDGSEGASALNEIAVFPSRSATLLEYKLTVNDEFVWRDYSDGVMISTPLGSTAYAMSAGGPMVLPGSPVFVVVSVNSLDVTRRPLVVRDDSQIEVSEITSRYECYAIADGTLRIKVRETVMLSRALKPARLVRLPQVSPTIDRMARKVRLAEDLLKMPPSAKLVLKTLQYEGPLTQKELVQRAMLPDRTARMALTLLVQKGLVRRQATLRDVRQRLYSIVA